MSSCYPSFTPTYHHEAYPSIDPSQPSLSCSSKTIIVTGAGRGIGQAIALAFARAFAHTIALIGRTPSTLSATAAQIKSLSPSTTVIIAPADLTSSTQVSTAFDQILHDLGTCPDILVHSAGGLPSPPGNGALIDIDIPTFWTAFETNAKATLLVTQAFLRASRAHSPDVPKTVINIASGAAHLPHAPGMAAYAVSKLAAAKLVEYVAHEQPGWNVFNVQPGVVDTDLAKQVGRKGEDDVGLPAGTVLWLAASEEARALTGRFVWANWDVDELVRRKGAILEGDLLTLGLRGWSVTGGEGDAS